MAMSEIQCRIEQAQLDAEAMRERIDSQKQALLDTTLSQFASINYAPLPRSRVKVRRTLKGHLTKIYALQWFPDSRHLISAAHDGKLIVWDTQTANKTHAISLQSNWIMAAAVSPTGNMVASGGLDNICSIFDVKDRNSRINAAPIRQLNAHTGYISCARFISDGQILTASGDSTCMLWDVERNVDTMTFRGHANTVMCLTLSPERNAFITAGCDATTRVWDLRCEKAQRVYIGHQKDINAVDCFPGGDAFVTGSDDYTCRLWDLRADRELQIYKNEGCMKAVLSVAFSHSGRTFFAAYEDIPPCQWDTMRAERTAILAAHELRVSCLGVSPDGLALATGGWDSTAKIWS